MHTSNYFATSEPRPCWTCHHYGGPLPDNNINGLCRHPRLSPVVGQPENGCAFWEREPGTDDEPHPHADHDAGHPGA
jgi:hypothetical protein